MKPIFFLKLFYFLFGGSLHIPYIAFVIETQTIIFGAENMNDVKQCELFIAYCSALRELTKNMEYIRYTYEFGMKSDMDVESMINSYSIFLIDSAKKMMNEYVDIRQHFSVEEFNAIFKNNSGTEQ